MKGTSGASSTGDVEGGETVERGQREVRKNDVGTKLLESRAELPLVGHGAGDARDAAG